MSPRQENHAQTRPATEGECARRTKARGERSSGNKTGQQNGDETDEFHVTVGQVDRVQAALGLNVADIFARATYEERPVARLYGHALPHVLEDVARCFCVPLRLCYHAHLMALYFHGHNTR
jgi:hypothetical protein